MRGLERTRARFYCGQGPSPYYGPPLWEALTGRVTRVTQEQWLLYGTLSVAALMILYFVLRIALEWSKRPPQGEGGQ